MSAPAPSPLRLRQTPRSSELGPPLLLRLNLSNLSSPGQPLPCRPTFQGHNATDRDRVLLAARYARMAKTIPNGVWTDHLPQLGQGPSNAKRDRTCSSCRSSPHRSSPSRDSPHHSSKPGRAARPSPSSSGPRSCAPLNGPALWGMMDWLECLKRQLETTSWHLEASVRCQETSHGRLFRLETTVQRITEPPWTDPPKSERRRRSRTSKPPWLPPPICTNTDPLMAQVKQLIYLSDQALPSKEPMKSFSPTDFSNRTLLSKRPRQSNLHFLKVENSIKGRWVKNQKADENSMGPKIHQKAFSCKIGSPGGKMSCPKNKPQLSLMWRPFLTRKLTFAFSAARWRHCRYVEPQALMGAPSLKQRLRIHAPSCYRGTKPQKTIAYFYHQMALSRKVRKNPFFCHKFPQGTPIGKWNISKPVLLLQKGHG